MEIYPPGKTCKFGAFYGFYGGNLEGLPKKLAPLSLTPLQNSVKFPWILLQECGIMAVVTAQ